MNNCLNCGKEVPQTPGKKQRKYCNDTCKQRHWHQQKADRKDMVKISREELDDLKRRAGMEETPLLESVIIKGEKIIREKDMSKVDRNLPGLTAGFKQFKSVQIPKGLKGIDLTIWKQEQKSKGISNFHY